MMKHGSISGKLIIGLTMAGERLIHKLVPDAANRSHRPLLRNRSDDCATHRLKHQAQRPA